MADDWSVDDYRMEHETVDHWELRKKFMLMHKDKFPEDKLVCLAQVFSNVEFMGCRYPSETMELVAELSRGIVEDYRNSRKSKLKRTFVGASDAAGAKVKGRGRPQASQSAGDRSSAITQNTPQHTSPTDSFKKLKSSHDSESSSVTYGPNISEVVQKRLNVPETSSSSEVTRNNQNSSPATARPTYNSSNQFPKATSGPAYGGVRTYNINKSTGRSEGPSTTSDFVIMRERPPNEPSTGVLLRSASASGYHAEYKVSGEIRDFKCELYMNGKLFTTAISTTKKLAKEEASRLALDQLNRTCYTIIVKKVFLTGSEVAKDHLENNSVSTTTTSDDSQSNLLNENNVGNKLLRLMGWTGGGLGVNNQGREEPVTVQEHVRRAGLGKTSNEANVSAEFKQKAWKLLKDYAHNSSKGCHKDLVFSTDYSREERAEIHQIARKLNLKSRSYNKKEERQLVVSYKYSIQDIVAQLKSCGGSNEKYQLIPPQPENAPDVIQID